jgi:hypothetical protein
MLALMGRAEDEAIMNGFAASNRTTSLKAYDAVGGWKGAGRAGNRHDVCMCVWGGL